jgi:hypothetical protein
MSAQTILTLANGRGIDLRAPHANDIDWNVIAEQTAKEARFNGATPGKFYSVAEHQCRGSDAIIRLTGDRLLAAYFHVHDGHEHVLKDKTTPYKKAIAEECEAQCGIDAEYVLAVIKNIEYRHDVAIHEAAGLAWPPEDPEIITNVKYWDKVMFVTEWRDLMQGIEHPNWAPYENVMTLAERILLPWPWEVAQKQYLSRCMKLLPSFAKQLALARAEAT